MYHISFQDCCQLSLFPLLQFFDKVIDAPCIGYLNKAR